MSTNLKDLLKKNPTAAELQALAEAEQARLQELAAELGQAKVDRREAMITEQLGEGDAAPAKASVVRLEAECEEAEVRLEAIRRKLTEAQAREATAEYRRLSKAAQDLETQRAAWRKRAAATWAEVVRLSDEALNLQLEADALQAGLQALPPVHDRPQVFIPTHTPVTLERDEFSVGRLWGGYENALDPVYDKASRARLLSGVEQ